MIARDIKSGWDDLRIYRQLRRFAKHYKLSPNLFCTFVVDFEGPGDLSEVGFEKYLWRRLQSLSDKHYWSGEKRDRRVSDDPESAAFSLSFEGEGFFAVGLHPHASRSARRFVRPAIVFNLHDQFEQLRAQGLYENCEQRFWRAI